MTIAYLHTAELHQQTFERLTRERAPGLQQVHLVVPELLARAEREGNDSPGLVAQVHRSVEGLADEGAQLIVCTCSTLGGVVESTPTGGLFHTLRIDRPMAERATARSGRILVVAAVEATLEPTQALLRECAAAQGTQVELVDGFCGEAWSQFQQGRMGAYLATLARFVESRARDVRVVVLAQATMADLPRLCPKLSVPVLSSPRSGVEGALARLAR